MFAPGQTVQFTESAQRLFRPKSLQPRDQAEVVGCEGDLLLVRFAHAPDRVLEYHKSHFEVVQAAASQ